MPSGPSGVATGRHRMTAASCPRDHPGPHPSAAPSDHAIGTANCMWGKAALAIVAMPVANTAPNINNRTAVRPAFGRPTPANQSRSAMNRRWKHRRAQFAEPHRPRRESLVRSTTWRPPQPVGSGPQPPIDAQPAGAFLKETLRLIVSADLRAATVAVCRGGHHSVGEIDLQSRCRHDGATAPLGRPFPGKS